MGSVLRPVRKRKKGRTLGRVDILRREDYAALELDPKVSGTGPGESLTHPWGFAPS